MNFPSALKFREGFSDKLVKASNAVVRSFGESKIRRRTYFSVIYFFFFTAETILFRDILSQIPLSAFKPNVERK